MPLPVTAVQPGNLNVNLSHYIHLEFNAIEEDGTIGDVLFCDVPVNELFTLIQQQGWLKRTPTTGISKVGMTRRTGT
jgi:hypothetical protein